MNRRIERMNQEDQKIADAARATGNEHMAKDIEARIKRRIERNS